MTAGTENRGVRSAETVPSGPLTLHRWRRLDWRFLLPAPEVGRMACAGAADDELRDALPLIAKEVLEPRSSADWRALTGTCDAVVLVRPTLDELRQAVPALRPGGWLYAEVRRSVLAARPRTLAGWRPVFERAGLTDVAVCWHAPGAREPATIVDVDAATALRHVLGLGRGGRLGALRILIATGLLRLGLLSPSLVEGSVTGRRPGLPS